MILEKEDPIVAEVRAARHQLATFYGNDLRKIAEAAALGFADYGDSDRLSGTYPCKEQSLSRPLAFA